MSTFRMWSCHLMPSIWRWQFMWYSQESWCIQRTKSMSLQLIEDCGVCGPLIHHLIIIITFIHIHLLPSAVLYTGTMNSLNIVPATDPDQPETLLLFSQYHHHHSDVGTFDCTVLLTISYTSQIYIYIFCFTPWNYETAEYYTIWPWTVTEGQLKPKYHRIYIEIHATFITVSTTDAFTASYTLYFLGDWMHRKAATWKLNVTPVINIATDKQTMYNSISTWQHFHLFHHR